MGDGGSPRERLEGEERPEGEASRSGLNRKCLRETQFSGCCKQFYFFAVEGMKGTGQSNEEEGRLSSAACSHISRAGPGVRSGFCAVGDPPPKTGQVGEDHRNCSRGIFKLKTRRKTQRKQLCIWGVSWVH